MKIQGAVFLIDGKVYKLVHRDKDQRVCGVCDIDEQKCGDDEFNSSICNQLDDFNDGLSFYFMEVK